MNAEESAAQRMLYTRSGRRDGTITRADSTAVYGPIWNSTTDDVWSHIARHHLPANPVYDTLRALGVPSLHNRLSPSSTAATSIAAA